METEKETLYLKVIHESEIKKAETESPKRGRVGRANDRAD